MPTWTLALLLLLAPPGPVPAQRVGRLVAHKANVVANPPGKKIEPTWAIDRGTEVMTEKSAMAFIQIQLGTLYGMVRMGSETRLRFNPCNVETALGVAGKACDLGIFQRLGKIFLSFAPTGAVAEPGVDRVDKWIETPTARRIRLLGTMVYVEVTAEGTTRVRVLEGTATVEAVAGGRPVAVHAGFETTVTTGEVPSPPTPVDPQHGQGSESNPEVKLIPDSPVLPPGSLPLDLPRMIPP